MRFRMTHRRSLIVGGLVLAVAIAAYLLRPRPIYDYMAGATGFVVSPDGQPLEGVRVTFRSDEVLYEAITPLRSAASVTDARGHFAFLFLSCGRPPGPYRITFEKAGFETLHVPGHESRRHRVVMQPAVPDTIASTKRPDA